MGAMVVKVSEGNKSALILKVRPSAPGFQEGTSQAGWTNPLPHICGQDPHVSQPRSHASPLSGALHRSLENLLVGPGGGGPILTVGWVYWRGSQPTSILS